MGEELKTVIDDRYNKISNRMGRMQSEILELTELVGDLKDAAGSQRIVERNIPPKTLNLPFENLETFTKFDETLTHEKSLQHETVSSASLNLKSQALHAHTHTHSPT